MIASTTKDGAIRGCLNDQGYVRRLDWRGILHVVIVASAPSSPA